MQFLLIAIVAAVVALVGAAPHARQNCPEATQFGILNVSPTNVTAGQILTITTDFTCAINTFGHIPEFTDYYITVPTNNNGHEPPILLSRRDGSGNDVDTFTVTVPDAYYFSGAGYVVQLDLTYSVDGPNGQPYSVVGGVEAVININTS